MFEPLNKLEESLVKAAGDPACRPQFYRDLLASDILIIDQNEGPLDIRDGTLQQGASISIQPWSRDGQDWLPIFSSTLRLEQSITQPSTFLKFNAKTFFELTKGANVILNPNSEYGKEFLADEIQGLLDGSIFRGGKGYTVERATQVLLGQPAEYPQELIDALGRLFKQHASVNAAYLAHIFNPERDEPPHNVVGIDIVGDWDMIMGAAGLVARDVLPPNTIVDFIRIDSSDTGVSEYMLKQTKPFYRKSFVRRLFGTKLFWSGGKCETREV